LDWWFNAQIYTAMHKNTHFFKKFLKKEQGICALFQDKN